MHKICIQLLEQLISHGMAYIIEDGHDIFIYFDTIASLVNLSRIDPPFVGYLYLSDKVKNKHDFPLWASSLYDGIMTPWGPGLCTANLMYLFSLEVFHDD